MRLEFAAQSERDDDFRTGNTQRLVNFYSEPLAPGGRAQNVLKAVPRANTFTTLPELFVRDMAEVDGKFYVLCGGTLYRVIESGTASPLGTAVSAAGSMIFGADLGTVCVVAGGRYFVWDGTTFSEPTTGAFSAFGAGAYIGGYVVLTEDGGRRFQWSALADATDLPGLNFATAESTDGNILRPVALQGRLLLMKSDSIEQWAPTGAAGADAFSLIPGGVFEVGLKARNLATRFSGGVFFVGDNDIAYISNGSQVQPISGPAVNTAIAQADPTDCFTYVDEGHIFCVIRFSDRPAFVYDIATGRWHERASGAEDAWQVRATANAFRHWYGGDDLGNIYRFARSGTDHGADLIRTAVSSTLYNEGQRFRVPLIELTGRMGQGVITDTQEPKVMISFSRDGGRTFGEQFSRDLGGVGEFDQLCRIRGIGSQRQLCMKVQMSDARDITLDASVNVVVT